MTVVRRAGRGRVPVVVAGATGSVGQRFVRLLEGHPWFEVVAVTASERSAGRRYGDIVRWSLDGSPPSRVAAMDVRPTELPLPGRIVFSALAPEAAGPFEVDAARAGHLVVSNARSHRMDPDVPLLVPEVNPDHLDLVRKSAFRGGAIVTNPNCSTIGLALALKPLHDAFGVERVHVVTLQAVSGAGLSGAAALDIEGNVIPYIAGEEGKIETETLKILGTFRDGHVQPAPLTVAAQCTRVPVADGHTQCVSVKLGRTASPEEVRAAWDEFRGLPQRLGLPSAPRRPVHVLAGEADPQPRLHRDLEGGMAASVGRLRPCPLFDYRFVTVSHNTIRGAAGGAILCAELAVSPGGIEWLADEVAAALADRREGGVADDPAGGAADHPAGEAADDPVRGAADHSGGGIARADGAGGRPG